MATLHVDPVAFQRMHNAAQKAEIDGFDSSVAAWNSVMDEPAPLFEKIKVVQDIPYDRIFPYGTARYDPNH